LTAYAQLFSTDDHADAMAVRGAMATTAALPANEVSLHG
jgi:hypothetical protein